MHTRLALFAGLSLAVAAVLPSRAAGAGPAAARAKGVSLAPLFDTQTRFKVKKTAPLRFRLEPSGTRVRSSDVSFSLRHAPNGPGIELPARESKRGVFEVQFTPQGPGQYWIAAAVRGVPGGSIPAVHLGVVGVAAGLIEVPPEEDVDVKGAKSKHAMRMR